MKTLENTLEYKIKALLFIESELVPFAYAVDTQMCVKTHKTCVLLANDTVTIVIVLATSTMLTCARTHFRTRCFCFIPRAFSPDSVVVDLWRTGNLNVDSQ